MFETSEWVRDATPDVYQILLKDPGISILEINDVGLLWRINYPALHHWVEVGLHRVGIS